MNKTSKAYKEHTDWLLKKAERGDMRALKSLAALALVIRGWRYGDKDPCEPPDDPGGCEIIILDDHRDAA